MTELRGRSASAASASAPYLYSEIRAATTPRTQDLLTDFATGYTTPYGAIPPPRYSRKGKARATDASLTCKECDAAYAAMPDQVERDERLSLSFARTRKSSHARAKSIQAVGSSDGYDGFLSDGTAAYRPNTPRRITDEHELRHSIARQSQASGHAEASSSRSPDAAIDSNGLRLRSASQKRTRKVRAGSRFLAAGPPSMRAGRASEASTATVAQYSRLLDQPILASASISAPEKSSLAATCAVLPSLYKVSRGRSANVSPSRHWDRRCTSVSVLSGSEEVSETELPRPQARASTKQGSRDRCSILTFSTMRSRETSHEGALFPSDDDDDDEGDGENGDAAPSSVAAAGEDNDDMLDSNELTPRRRRSRRWSSAERDRRRSMRILLSPCGDVDDDEDDAEDAKSTAAAPGGRRPGRRFSASSELTTTSECPSELDANPSSCSSSSDIAGESRRALEALSRAIPIRPRATTTGPCSAGGGSSSSLPDGGATSVDTSNPSFSSSAPSTSLVQPTPPEALPLAPETRPQGTLKPIVPVPVVSGLDPLLGLTISSIEDIIEVEQVEFCGSDSASESDGRVGSTRPNTKAGGKLSWIIGDGGDDDEEDKPDRGIGTGAAPAQSSQSYQARLAGLPSQFRLWTRGQDGGRERQPSADGESVSSGLLSNSWRSLARLPNLILLPGLAARQARDNLLASSRSALDEAAPGEGDAITDLATIFRNVSAQNQLSKEEVEARRQAAFRMGRPPSPSPSPSPPASLNLSRQSSSDSVAVSHQRSSSQPPASAKKGRGVATPYEGDRDPSAYVSGLGQPIDPDTELSSVVHLQTFRSRSRSRSVTKTAGSRADPQLRADDGGPGDASSPKPEVAAQRRASLGVDRAMAQPSATADEVPKSPRRVQVLELTVVIPPFGSETDHDGNGPMDTASAPTSPTYRRNKDPPTAGSDSGSKQSEEDEDGFRLYQTRRQRRRSSGPRSTRPKVESLVPRDYSAFAIDEEDGREDTSSDPASSDSEQTRLRHRSRSRGRQGRGRGRGAGGDSSPTRLGKRQCAVGLFGGGVSSRRREGSSASTSFAHHTGIRSVRSSPDLTYAAAAASGGSRSTDDEEDGASPPRGSRGRRGAVKVVASSVGQNVTPSESLTMNQRLRRGPSYPPRAACSSSTPPDAAAAAAAATAAAAAAADASSCGGGAGSVYNGAASTPPAQLRLRLLSNSSHLLMLSLELEMIKKQKISGPLKPRWGKHRANDFVPLPKRSFGFVGSKRGSAAVSAPPLVAAAEEAGVPSRSEVGSRLKFVWVPEE
ncbi:hypothetical protein ACQY0O_007625 [Thecaphora frezii]